LGRHSPTKGYIIIGYTTPELYDRFYKLRKQTRSLSWLLKRPIDNNRDFIEFMLDLVEDKLVEIKRKHVVSSY
jgi:hypothetical protein